jgi:putative ABC transport system ATP-binding protein
MTVAEAGSLPPVPPDTNLEPVVRIERLNHHFGDEQTRTQVLFDIFLEIPAGEVVIMTGPSGCGKTTLLTLIGGLRTVQEGSVKVLGQELCGLGGPELVPVRRGIGFIFQRHNLLESLTALQNVRMGLELRDYAPGQLLDRATRLLNTLKMTERVGYKPAALSGGQRQRVAVARALANRPKLILDDEPTAALDQESGAIVVQLLRDLATDDRCTSLIVTHDSRILKKADRIVSMSAGRIVSNVLIEESRVICEFLQKLDLFTNLSPVTLADVADKMVKERHSPGTRIVRQGEEGHRFYLIRSGRVEVIHDDGLPERRIVATLGAGEFFGEQALIYERPRNATVQAIEEVITYGLGKADFQNALKASPTLDEQLRRVYSQRQ